MHFSLLQLWLMCLSEELAKSHWENVTAFPVCVIDQCTCRKYEFITFLFCIVKLFARLITECRG